jgi:hypothetical protein
MQSHDCKLNCGCVTKTSILFKRRDVESVRLAHAFSTDPQGRKAVWDLVDQMDGDGCGGSDRHY